MSDFWPEAGVEEQLKQEPVKDEVTQDPEQEQVPHVPRVIAPPPKHRGGSHHEPRVIAPPIRWVDGVPVFGTAKKSPATRSMLQPALKKPKLEADVAHSDPYL